MTEVVLLSAILQMNVVFSCFLLPGAECKEKSVHFFFFVNSRGNGSLEQKHVKAGRCGWES